MHWKTAAWALLLGACLFLPQQARAVTREDCSSHSGQTCIHETFVRDGASRVLHISLLRQYKPISYYNVIMEGRKQFEVEAGNGFSLVIPESGKAVYSFQACSNYFPARTTCRDWVQIVRQYPSRETCGSYTNDAIASVTAAQNLGCGFSGPRWSADPQLHLNACFDQGENHQSFLNAETNQRAIDVAACQAQVAAATKPVKKTTRPTDGSGKSASIPGGFLTCTGGGMRVDINKDSAMVYYKAANHESEDGTPARGECAWADRVAGEKEATRIAFMTSKDKAAALIDAARKGGTFVVAGRPMTAFIMVNEIVSVEGEGAAPAPVEPDAVVVDEPQEEEEAMPDAVASADCPAGSATVSTASVGETMLNVRATPSTSAKVVRQVRDGSEVNVVGACTTGAGFAKAKTLKPKEAGGKAQPEPATQASGGWCRIDAPAQGCVKAEFLSFDDAAGAGGAGLARAKTLKPQGGGDGGGAKAKAPTFAGKWSVVGDDEVDYAMTMTQKGSDVSGRFTGGDGSKGSFNGKVKGKVLRFSWKQTDGYSGSGKFTLAEDGSSFDGSYNFGRNADEVEGSWNGTRD